MMQIRNTCSELDTLFPQNRFCMDIWTEYINHIIPGSSEIFLADIRDYDFERQCLPVIQNALTHPEKRAEAAASFEAVTNGLEEKIKYIFHRDLTADILLYLGLCNGAGWVKAFNGRTTILLGIEKIIELDWCSEKEMYGLIYHELGHVYQAQYGILKRDCADSADALLWQLFTEDIAMYFEQTLIGDPEFWHQDRYGWRAFMDAHFEKLKRDFCEDLNTMNSRTQRYFGDWADYHGFGDAGYYLGTKFVRFLLERHTFDQIIAFDLPEVKSLFRKFLL